MPLEPGGARPGRGAAPARHSQPNVRITMFPAAAPARPRPATLRRSAPSIEGPAGWVALASAALLLVATVGWAPLAGFVTHGLADYHYWAGREAYRRGEAQIVVQGEWQRAIAIDPGYARVRLDLARSYIDTQWLGGAIEQSEAVLSRPHDRREASLAYTYMGYCHYLLGEHAAGEAELSLAVDYDKQNSLAQSVLERLRREGKLPALP